MNIVIAIYLILAALIGLVLFPLMWLSSKISRIEEQYWEEDKEEENAKD